MQCLYTGTSLSYWPRRRTLPSSSSPPTSRSSTYASCIHSWTISYIIWCTVYCGQPSACTEVIYHIVWRILDSHRHVTNAGAGPITHPVSSCTHPPTRITNVNVNRRPRWPSGSRPTPRTSRSVHIGDCVCLCVFCMCICRCVRVHLHVYIYMYLYKCANTKARHDVHPPVHTHIHTCICRSIRLPNHTHD